MKFIRKNLILKSMMLIGTFALSIGGSLSFYYIDQEISAEAVQIDDGPLGEKIVDIEVAKDAGRGDTSAALFALTENGHVYAWGENYAGILGDGTLTARNIPKKVLNVADAEISEPYLNDIVKIRASGLSAFAINSKGELFAWGRNKKNNLGLNHNNDVLIPEKVSLSFKVKDIAPHSTYNMGNDFTYLLSENGDVYVTGETSPGGLGLGSSVAKVDEFTQIEFDYDGNPLPKMKQISVSSVNNFMIPDCDNGDCIDGIYSTNSNGWRGFGGIGEKVGPSLGILPDETILTNVKEIVNVPWEGAPIIRLKNGDLYTTCNGSGKISSYISISDPANNLIEDPEGLFANVKQFNCHNGGTCLFLSSDNQIYNLSDYGYTQFSNNTPLKISEYSEGEIPKGYTNAKKVIAYSMVGGGSPEAILSNNGAVYIDGVKIRFGEISVLGIKESDSSAYLSKEKYNGNIKLQVDVLNDSHVELTESDFMDNSVNKKELENLELTYEVVENKRINKKLDFTATSGSEVYSISFEIDLFKSTPLLGGYVIGVTNYIAPNTPISLAVPTNQSGWNSYIATITDPSGTTTDYNGESIDGAGTYTLHVTDEYGNTADYQFEVTTNPIPSFNFQTQHSSIVYGGTGSRANDTLGNITLTYDENITPNIKTIQFVSGGDENKFTLENDGTLKVGNADLDAGTYTLNITGTDGNNMPFNGTISIVVEKAEQPDYKIVTGTKEDEIYSFVFQNNDTIQIGTKGKLSSGTETLTIIVGAGTVASLQGTTPETFKTLSKGNFTIEATVTGDTNYKEKTVTQEITLSDLPTQDPLVITGDDTVTYGDNNNTYPLNATGGSTGSPIQWSIDSDTGLNGEQSGTNATISGNLVTFNHVGKFTLKATMNGNGSYQDISATKTITVNKMNVAVTPNPVSKYVGQAFNKVKLKGVSYSPSPLSGDDIGTPAITSKYPDSQAAGIYNDGLEVTGLSNDNYTFQYQTGALTILDVTLPEPSDQDKSPYYEVTGTKGKNGWYTSDIQIKTTGKDGYTKISQTNGSFTGDTITVSSEGENDISLYFQNTDGTITKPITYKAKIDKTAPSIPTMTVDEINTSRIARLLNMLSFGSWMNEEAQVTMLSNDGISGIDHYEYIETIKGSDSQPKSSNGILTYGDETELLLKARACDKAGNCSTYSISEELKIDKKGPTILGVKDQSVYKQYYSPRFVTVTDLVSGLKQATYKKDGNPAGAFADNVETPIKGEGSYEIYAIDEAGNEITITFKILKLPNIDTEIDGSDESRELIDQIIKEYEEVKDKIDPSEKEEYEEWIKEAEDKWESLRKKVIEHEETTSKVEGQGDTNFDPSTKLIVEEIPKDKVPVLPRNAIKTYDVRLMKGDKEILPNGDIKVYLPYTEQEAPIVYEIDDDGTITELPSQQENGYVTFITNTLKKYAISNTKQEENKDPDDNNGNDNQKPTPNPDDGKDPDNNKPDPNPDDGKNPDDNNDPTDDDKVCSVGPDGKPNTNDDVCGKPNEDGDKPSVNPDGSITVPDGGSVIFPDGSEVELPDGGTIKPDGSVELPDGTIYDKDGNKKEPNKKQCDIKDKYLNIDSDGDGRPDVNLDIDGDCYPDLNIDTDNDGYPNVNIDTTGDGKPNINIDTDNDGKADINIVLKLPAWNPKLNATVDGFDYDTMSGIEPDLNVDTTGDGKPNINVDTDGDGYPDQNVEDDWYTKRGLEKPSSNTNVKGNYTKGDTNTGGVSTGDNTKWYIWLFLMFCTLSTMGYNYYRKHKQK